MESQHYKTRIIYIYFENISYAGLAKFDWKVVAQWATKDINLVAQQ